MKIIGSIVPRAANYNECGYEVYDNNPCISALPPLMDSKEIIGALQVMPNFTEELRSKSKVVRRHAVSSISNSLIPITRNLSLHEKFSRLIRDSYIHRNLNDPAYFAWKKRLVESFKKKKGSPKSSSSAGEISPGNDTGSGGALNTYGSHPQSMLLTGPPGSGKSYSLERSLSLYPDRIICHPNVGGEFFTQLPYLYVQCPHIGSVKGLVGDLIKQVAFLVGTSPEDLIPTINRGSADVLIPELINLVTMYSVGVIIIDEVEAIRSAPSGGDDAIIQFWVRLINEAGLPLILIANPDINKRFEEQLKILLRLSGAGAMNFDRLQKDSKDWQRFLRKLFAMQLTKVPTPLSPEIAAAMYDKSQGILKLATYLFTWVQEMAIEQSTEEITPNLINRAFQENGFLVDRIIKGLSINQHVATDTNSRWLVEIAKENGSEQTTTSNGTTPSVETPSTTDSSIVVESESEPKKRAPKKSKRKLSLPDYLKKEVKGNLTTYAALVRDGWMKPVDEFLC